jgi:diacylglycerol kinase family enzyme
VHADGSLGPKLEKGALLYEGEASMVAASTIPFYGYGIRMFPFAERLPRCMHLRIFKLNSIPRLLLNVRSLWKGRWFPPGMHDFVAEDVMVSCAKPMPCQVGGDAAGERDNMRLKLSALSIPLMDFGAPLAPSKNENGKA